MRFLKATVFTLLTSSAAVLGDPTCDNSAGVYDQDAGTASYNIKAAADQCEATSTEAELPMGHAGSASIRAVADGVDKTSSYWYVGRSACLSMHSF